MEGRHFGVSSIAIEGDVQAGQQYVPRAKGLLRALLARARTGNIEVASDYVKLAENAYCYAIVARGVNKAVIVVDPGNAPLPSGDPYIIPEIPDFYSGATLNGYIIDGPAQDSPKRLADFWPTSDCARLFKLPNDPQHAIKLAVRPYAPFGEVLDNARPPPVFSQYTKLRPTMYSGRMRAVVQLLMGFGQQHRDSIYDKAPPTMRRRQPRGKKKAEATTYEKQVARNGRQIRYDWRFVRTHGITTAADGKLWLVEIGLTRGIIAMQLPLHPLTLLPEFRDKLDRLNDSAGLFALDELGGFPTGETFPAVAMDSWIRAGRVVRLAEEDALAHFYRCSDFGDGTGWAFNTLGREAHNTCWEYADDFIQTAYHYAVRISIGSSDQIEPAPNAQALKRRFDDIRGEDGVRDRYDAVIWKCDRIDDGDIASLLNRSLSDLELFDEVDAIELDPIASGNASVSLDHQGRLYFKAKYQPHLKFPNYALGYCLTHSMNPQLESRSFDGRCDTIVHVWFDGDALKYVKFFSDPRPGPTDQVTSDEEECMFIGAWSRQEDNGTLAVPAMVYTNDFDDREELPAGRSRSLTTGEDLGYTQVAVSDDPSFPPHAVLFRSKSFLMCTDRQTWSGLYVKSAVTVPFHDRCAYYYTVARGHSAYSRSYTCGHTGLGDPWSCGTWRNFPGWTGFTSGGLFIPAEHPDGCGPVSARTVREPGATYSGGPCSDFADSGPWCFVCENADAMTYFTPLPDPGPGIFESDDGAATRQTTLVNCSEFSPLPMPFETPDPLAVDNPWFIPSPDPDTGDTQYIDVTHNAFGDGTTLRYMERTNSGPVRLRGAPQHPSMENAGTTFVGVV